MTKLTQYVEEMRMRLSEIARDEQALVQALGDALNRLDQQLLSCAARTSSGLADGIGMVHQPLGVPQAPEELPPYRRTNGFQERIVGPRDWRQAISKAPSF